MATAVKVGSSYTIEPEIKDYVATTKGERSASARVNELLRRAMLDEMNEKLEAEARIFYAEENKHRAGAVAFQQAAIETFNRD